MTISARPVYPRWRGEHSCPPRCAFPRGGLSPLARGTRNRVDLDGDWQRFIPAGAGNTPSQHRFGQRPSVYPRWRGEHLAAAGALFVIGGLSPLARGTRLIGLVVNARWRFIPAGAGNTKNRLNGAAWSSVYPRWRGEHTGRRFQREVIAGLSPLARGTLTQKHQSSEQLRFIPAGAGNTYHRHDGLRISPVYPRWRGEHPVITSASKV